MLWLILDGQEATKDSARKRKWKWKKGGLSILYVGLSHNVTEY